MGPETLALQAAPLWLYEATRKVFGRGFDSRQVHHMHIEKPTGTRLHTKRSVCREQCAADGPAQVSTGARIEVDSSRADCRKQREMTLANDDVYAQAIAA